MDGACASTLSQSGSPTAGFHCGLVGETASDTDTPGPRSPIAKNVSVLRVNHATPQDLLPGVRQGSQSRLGLRSVQALRDRLVKREQMFRFMDGLRMRSGLRIARGHQ
jgi:hypothetical protein